MKLRFEAVFLLHDTVILHCFILNVARFYVHFYHISVPALLKSLYSYNFSLKSSNWTIYSSKSFLETILRVSILKTAWMFFLIFRLTVHPSLTIITRPEQVITTSIFLEIWSTHKFTYKKYAARCEWGKQHLILHEIPVCV